jgi:hypothetical protein
MTTSVNTIEENASLPYLSNQDRLKVFQILTSGAQHLWSKNKLQEDRLTEILNALAPLTVNDPNFLARLTSYVFRDQNANKDLKVMTAYINALSTADGMPFSPGSKYNRPNLRYVSAAAIQMLEPKLVARITEFEGRKWSVGGYFNLSRHFPNALRTAVSKYLKYRELNPDMLRGIVRAGLKNQVQKMYIKLHLNPTDEAASILRWNQKDRKIEYEKRSYDFSVLDDLDIAKEIRKQKLPFIGALAELSRVGKKISPVIAVALLERATGDQAVIARKTFEDAGILKDAEVAALYEEKIKTAKNALDRLQAFESKVDSDVKKMLQATRAEVRKEQVGDIGKVYLMIDASGSMNATLEFAKQKGAMIAELVKNPQENFNWGIYDIRGMELPLPEDFVADAFKARLFGITMGGGTDCFALYPNARRFGADVDIHVTDGGHNTGPLSLRIEQFHQANPNVPKPKACVIIDYDPYHHEDNLVKEAYEENGIPVAIIKPETLDNSALVTSAVKMAIEGPMAMVDNIMETKLLELPQWYLTI